MHLEKEKKQRRLARTSKQSHLARTLSFCLLDKSIRFGPADLIAMRTLCALEVGARD
jgi:hypothetical protein